MLQRLSQIHFAEVKFMSILGQFNVPQLNDRFFFYWMRIPSCTSSVILLSLWKKFKYVDDQNSCFRYFLCCPELYGRGHKNLSYIPDLKARCQKNRYGVLIKIKKHDFILEPPGLCWHIIKILNWTKSDIHKYKYMIWNNLPDQDMVCQK